MPKACPYGMVFTLWRLRYGVVEFGGFVDFLRMVHIII